MSHWWDLDGGATWAGGEAGPSAEDQTLESMPVGLMELDHEWTVRYLNTAAEATVGYTRAELVGRDYWAAFPANVHNEFGQAYRQAVDTGEPVVVEAYYPEPLHQWFEVRAVPTRHGLWLYFTETTARRQAQERLALIARVSDTLAGAIDTPSIAGRIPDLITPGLASWAALVLLDDEGRQHIAGAAHADGRHTSLVHDYATAALTAAPADAPLQRALHSGRRTVLGPADLTGPGLCRVAAGRARDLLAQLAPRTLTVHPLPGRDRMLGALVLGNDAHRTADPLDDAATAEVAVRTALALDNARLYQRQTQLAAELQRHMLTPPPEPDHAEVAVRYLPAAHTARVGGDWYDVFLQPDGATVVVVGDVVGHDTAAAAAMGQLRSMLRGIAVTTGAPPAQLIRQLDEALPQLQLSMCATLAVLRFEQDADQLARGVTSMRWASAGHPAPLVIRPDRTLADPLPEPGELMLGIDPSTPRTDSVVEVERDSTVLLHTDGLVERRDRDIDAGTRVLRDHVADLAHLPLEQLCDQVIARMVDHDAEDDVALVAVRLHRQDRPRPDEAGPVRVPDTVAADPAGG